MHREDLEYSSDYGTDSLRVDRFGGAPSLLESAIRVYELGVLGPRHVCIEFCDCSSCRKLRWFNNPKCNCALGKMWGKYFTLDGAMRVKWLRCRCNTLSSLATSASLFCKCLLLLPTQEYNPSEGSTRPEEYEEPSAEVSSSDFPADLVRIEFDGLEEVYRLG
ncbi:hypothetical protein KC19_2G126800 [Ceratodon purpureus]|uniref:Uncharacterized protein n=1 Tax=Ceratodon purpureus TaxID=3225 RepID=A0A8T0H6U2_CERPU|nr:hypothetical protein KC19_N013900 [Ceratodon purpureus]KAG0504178.1 hypothetical protein KC19_N008700 [Ceratodon purpureus]KAG0504299.1 hypothetical protein KC19_N044400 [Ceratodon purpureus]KAG0504311.1 hypothetical protein KC19_N044200 [Ceratodon purpureus]KAG0565699.1 hypothetical protein KC19_7G008500 [Ceratodon purpureus]